MHALFQPARRPLVVGTLLAALICILDQISKWLILNALHLPDRGSVEVTTFFNLRMAWNPGVSFGLFPADTFWGRTGLVIFAVGVVIFLLLWLRKAANRLTAIAIGLIVGGAVGNVWDRLHYGAVVDFLDFHLLGHHFYTFNVADAAISTGVALLIIEAVFGRGTERKDGQPRAGTADAPKQKADLDKKGADQRT